MGLSIRWRLTLWNTLALTFVLLGFAALVYGLLHHALYQHTDRKLLSGLEEIEQDPRAAGDLARRLRHTIDELYEHEHVFAVVYGPDGQVRERTAELAEASVPPPPQVASEPQLHDTTVPNLGRQRVLGARLRLGG